MPFAAIITNLVIWPVAVAVGFLVLLPMLIAGKLISLLAEDIPIALKVIMGLVAAILGVIGIPGLVIALGPLIVFVVPVTLWFIAKVLVSAIGATVTYPFKLIYDDISNWYAEPYVEELLKLEEKTMSTSIEQGSERSFAAAVYQDLQTLEMKYSKENGLSKFEFFASKGPRFGLNFILRLSPNKELDPDDPIVATTIRQALLAWMILNPKIEAKIAARFECYQYWEAKEQKIKAMVPCTYANFFKALGLQKNEDGQEYVPERFVSCRTHELPYEYR